MTHTDRSLRMLVARSSVGKAHVPISLANENLEMVNTPYIDLRGANLAGANLRGAMLWGACLESASLDGADLTCADLTWSSLIGASLRGTLLVEADLDEALVDGFDEAITAGADLCTITFSEGALKALLEKGENVEACSKADEEEDILDQHRSTAPLSLRLRGANGYKISRELGRRRDGADDWYKYKEEKFQTANARVLSDTNLLELLSWSAKRLQPLNLRGCNLSGANLSGAQLDGACLAYTTLTGAKTQGASFVGVDKEGSFGW